ncbi:hypothetical protein F5Y09DRAFT_88886, partial [Xylaria sp. FL1042]
REHRTGSFPCEQCGTVLSRRDALVRHTRVLHGTGMAFRCRHPQCVAQKKGFSRFLEYRKHMLQVHHTVLSNGLIPDMVANSDQSSPDADGHEVAEHAAPEPEPEPARDVEFQGQSEPQIDPWHLPPQIPFYQPGQSLISQYFPGFDFTEVPAFIPTHPYPVRPSQVSAVTPSYFFTDTELFNSCVDASREMRANANAQQSLYAQPDFGHPVDFDHEEFTRAADETLFGSQQVQPQVQQSRPEGTGFIMERFQSRYSEPWSNELDSFFPLYEQ